MEQPIPNKYVFIKFISPLLAEGSALFIYSQLCSAAFLIISSLIMIIGITSTEGKEIIVINADILLIKYRDGTLVP